MISMPIYWPGKLRESNYSGLRAPLYPPISSDTGSHHSLHAGRLAADNNDIHKIKVTSDIELAYHVQGHGKKIAFVLHGGPGMPIRGQWPGLSSLGSEYSFVFWDQRGCGESTRPFPDRIDSANVETIDDGASWYAKMQVLEGTLGLAEQIADIERMRNLFGAECVLMIGHSFGGFIASMYAIEFPQRVCGLVLIAPADILEFPPHPDTGFMGLVQSKLATDEPQMAKDFEIWMANYINFADLFSNSEETLRKQNLNFAKYVAPALRYNLHEHKQREVTDADSVTEATRRQFEALEDFAASVQSKPVESLVGGWVVQASYLSMGMSHSWSSSLSAIKSPTLVIHGKYDLQPRSVASSYLVNIPNSEWLELPSTHFPMHECPLRFGVGLAKFVHRLPLEMRDT
jgi:pimeloyl-ACP methyl ester carboxylesterase